MFNEKFIVFVFIKKNDCFKIKAEEKIYFHCFYRKQNKF